MASLLAVRGLGRLVEGVPPAGAWSVVVIFLCDAAIALFVPWVLLAGVVRARLLLPGALIVAVVNLAARPATIAWFPTALKKSADDYGSIGVAFTYLALLVQRRPRLPRNGDRRSGARHRPRTAGAVDPGGGGRDLGSMVVRLRKELPLAQAP